MAAVPVTAGAVKGWNGNRSFAIWAGSGDADLCRRRGEVLTARRTFKLELHGHQIFVQEKFVFNVVPAVGASRNFQQGRLAN